VNPGSIPHSHPASDSAIRFGDSIR